MKLRNKKTGEIKDFLDVAKEFINGKNGKKTFTLAELNEEWEDYEEPKEYWYIDCNGAVRCDEDSDFASDCKQIDNYFETKKEAVKAVEKLQAWKRLKDKGFRFKDFTRHFDGFKRVDGDVFIAAELNDEGVLGMIDDLNICFGGEE